MNYPIDVAMPTGAVALGPDVVCDGFLSGAKVRVQTHVHGDHMHDFETSKGHQQVIASEPTRALLVAILNADLPYRANVRGLPESHQYEIGNSKVSLMSSGHMLGSVQVCVELQDGTRVGYSGDFQWPVDQVIQVDALVIDSTNGTPENVRRFSPSHCEDQFVAILRRLIAVGPVIVRAWRGTMQRALQIVHDEIRCPIICSERLAKEMEVYRSFGYTIGPLISHPSPDSHAVMQDGRYVRVYSTGDETPVDIGAASRIVLSAYDSQPDTPVTEYSPKAFCIAMSSHADFEGILDYVRNTNAEYVVTDNTRSGKAYDLAVAIRQRLGIEARPSSNVIRREWGA